MVNILYAGNLNSYVTQNDVLVFKENKYEVSLLDVYHVERNCREGLIDYEKVITLYDANSSNAQTYLNKVMSDISRSIIYDCLKLKAKKFREIIENNAFDLVWASWGANMIPLVKIIQKAKFKVPIIYNFLSYPQNIYTWKVFLENLYCQDPIENLDGRIHATNNMYQYMDYHFDLEKHGLDMVMTPFFSRKYFYRKRLPLLSENDSEPHVVYIGPVKLPWDDIRQEIYEINKEKIHFHIAQTNIPIKNNPYLHFFPYFPLEKLTDGSLATYMTQFDACIVLFNFKVCSCMDRFYTSYPSRFLFALNAGIPIVMPGGFLPACEELMNKYQIGFSYKNIKELRKKLKDDYFMKRFRINAIRKTIDFSYEKNIPKLKEFIKGVTS